MLSAPHPISYRIAATRVAALCIAFAAALSVVAPAGAAVRPRLHVHASGAAVHTSAVAPLNYAYFESVSPFGVFQYLDGTTTLDHESSDDDYVGISSPAGTVWLKTTFQQPIMAGQTYSPGTGVAAGITSGQTVCTGEITIEVDQIQFEGTGQPTAAALQFSCQNQDGSTISGAAAANIEPTTPGQGYYEYGADGAIYGFGNDNYLNYLGDLSATTLNQPIVGMAITPDGGGYWLVASDGGIFAYGDATFYGSTGALTLNQPIVGMAATPDGGGYWLVASDGGIFSYGDAAFYGSTGALHLNQPIVGMAATPDGHGYWLVASDGGIFAYGDAQFYGSTGALHLNQPVVGMAATPDGHGYWFVASDGGIFAYGDAQFSGSTGALHLNQPIVGMDATSDGKGYLLVASDGGLFAFGDAQFSGSLGGQGIDNIVGIAS